MEGLVWQRSAITPRVHLQACPRTPVLPDLWSVSSSGSTSHNR